MLWTVAKEAAGNTPALHPGPLHPGYSDRAIEAALPHRLAQGTAHGRRVRLRPAGARRASSRRRPRWQGFCEAMH
jgi:hypothetical protein